MNAQYLTDRAAIARTRSIRGKATMQGLKIVAVSVLTSLTLAGCITVNAPEEPIVIELNVNIRQEVIYRLAADAGNTIEENADIF